jgi:uncharacterized protein (DUF1501 family)
MPLSRREFLAGGLGLSLGLSLSLADSAATAQSAKFSGTSLAGQSNYPPVLVVLTLVGGNDAFNTLVPYAQGAYYDGRRTLALPDSTLLPVAPGLALNDALAPLFKRFQRGEMALLPGVGWLCEKNGGAHPFASRSHSRAAEIMHSARPDIIGDTGWLDRYLQETAAESAPSPLNVLPASLYGEGKLARSLAAVAAQICSNSNNSSNSGASGHLLRPAVHYLAMEGFDTHSGQSRRHRQLLGELACALDSFMRDLEERAPDQGRSVMVLVQSEFGRRLKENSGDIFAPPVVSGEISEAGTDHGSSGLSFLVGAAVRGGIYSEYGNLARPVDGEVAATVDFRTIYATILESFFQADSVEILGKKYERLDFC